MALPESGNPKEGPTKKTTDQDDKDFDPTPEALIDEIDDERTLEEEEALDGITGAAVQEELDDLKKESEMPIEELLAYYERMRNEAQGSNSDRDEEENDDDVDDDDDDDEDDNYDDEEDENDVGANRNEQCNIKSGKKREKEDDDGEDEGEARRKRDSSYKYIPTDSSNHKSLADSTSQQQGSGQVSETKPGESSESRTTLTMANCTKYKINCSINTESSDNSTVNSSAKQATNADSTHEAFDNDMEDPSSCEGADDESGSARSQRPKHPMTDFIVNDENGEMFDSLFGYDLDDSDDDYSYSEGDEGDDERTWRRVIHVGPDFQADVPDGLTEYDYLPPYENEDKLVWKWSVSPIQEKILEYLKQASTLSKKKEVSISPSSVPKISYDKMRSFNERMQDHLTSNIVAQSTENNHQHPPLDVIADLYISQSRKRALIDYKLEQENAMDAVNQVSSVEYNNQILGSREDYSDTTSQDNARPELSAEEYFQDEEQLLYLLLQCNHNVDEALRRRRLDPCKYYLYEPMSLWSEDECLCFENGLKMYGKNFRLIRENKVPTRTYAEVVAFYYLWKKSERHDVYTNQYKLDRKRCLSHPGTTDYMDKFIEDNESNINATSSTCTPTPTESAIGLSSSLDVSRDNNISLTPCQPSNIQVALVSHINLSPESTTQRHHLQLHHPQQTETCSEDK